MISIAKRTGLMLVALIGLAVAAPAVVAQEELAPEHLTLARKYVDLTDKSFIYESALVETASRTYESIASANPTGPAPAMTTG